MLRTVATTMKPSAEGPLTRAAPGTAARGDAEEEVLQAGRLAAGELGADLGEGAQRDRAAVDDDEDAVAELLHEREQVRGEDDGGARLGAGLERALHLADAERVEAGEGLVEEHQARVVEEAAGDGELLLHAAGELAGEDAGLAVELQLGEQRAGARLPVHDAVEARHQVEVLAHGEVVEEAGLVREERELALGGHGRGGEVVPGDADGAARGREDAAQAAQRARLAGAVGADQAEHLAGGDLEREVVDGGEAAVALRQAMNLEHRLAHASPPAAA